ncbi:major facilitator superfamily-domain-containing protein [Limtongia smithiae]|uniref:major facilitator superfamily-domain-containing protein n=1 Tax=Limtongia smithiae TaxID=1125753 RepID=UPI0034CF81D4
MTSSIAVQDDNASSIAVVSVVDAHEKASQIAQVSGEYDPTDAAGLFAEDPESRPPVFKSALSETVCMMTFFFVPMMNSSNQGAVQLCLTYLSSYFGIEGSELSWTVTSYTLVAGSVFLLVGRLADIIGRKRTLIFAIIWYSVLSLCMAFVKSAIVFDALRGLQALGGAAAPPSAVGIISLIYRPSKRKNHAMAMYAAGAPVGYTIGVVVGGICVEYISWKAVNIFWTILYSLVCLFVWLLVPSDENLIKMSNYLIITGGGTTIQPINKTWPGILIQLQGLDFMGAALSICGMTIFIFSLTSASSAPNGWGTPYIIALLIVSVIFMVIFVLWELHCKNPLMPMYIWKFPGFALCMSVVFCGWLTFQGVLMYYPSLYFQNIRNYSIIKTTAAMLPLAISGILTNVGVALLLHKIPGRVLMFISMICFLASSLLWALQPIDILYWAMPFPALAIVIVGADLTFNVVNHVSLAAVPPNLKSTAAGTFNVVVQLSGAIGLAVSTAVVTSQIGTDITNQDPAILHRGYKCAYWFAVAMSGVGAILSLFQKIGTQGGKDSLEQDKIAIKMSERVQKPERSSKDNEATAS